MLHPVTALYQHLTYIVESALGKPEHTDNACSCCQRPATAFGNSGYVGLDSYKMPFTHCTPCRAMNVTDVSIMGIERAAGKSTHVIGNRFGMFPGVGWVHEINSGRSTLLAPPGVFIKLPPSFFEKITVVEMTTAGHLQWIAKNATFPLLYIESFGRKTNNLIRGLTISQSPAALYCCSDEGMDSVTRVSATVDLGTAIKLCEQLAPLERSERNAFTKLVREISNGRLSPQGATEILQKKPSLATLFRLLPADPHQRIKLAALTEKL